MIKFTNFKLMGCLLFSLIFGFGAVAQTSIQGSIVDSDSKEALLGASVLVKGKLIGTISNTSGDFSLDVSTAPPLTLVVSMVGYASTEVLIEESDVSGLEIALSEQAIMGQEIVIAASRVEENVMQAPVAIEKMDILEIKQATSPSFYDALKNLKGVDVSTQSLTFSNPNIRGFGSNGNTRIVQLIDGVDNQAPGLNFSAGNIVGIPELDLERVEVLPGAASALYGPNALNGIILMTSKNPFEYQGLSASTKFGVTHLDGEDDDPGLYKNLALRYAKAFDNKFAFKVNVDYLQAQDFRAVDYRDRNQTELSANDFKANSSSETYSGVNVYGSPVVSNKLFGDQIFAPIGYKESELLDNTTTSLKLNGSLHYRINDDIEASLAGNFGKGSTVYTANDRFVLDNFSIWSAKAEIKGSNFYLRAYTTQEDAGDTYAANTLASIINYDTQIEGYIGAFATALGSGMNYSQAHARALPYSRSLRLDVDSEEFNEKAAELRGISIADGGAKFLDKSNMYHYEGMYNFSDKIEFADVIVGANFRTYNLKSEGTLFALTDDGEEVSYNEFGGYVQASKSLMDDKVKLSGSVRYDKNENFKGQFSPRISGVFSPTPAHNFRASYQKAFRNPTAQDQFIDLDVVTKRLIGSNKLLIDRYNFKTTPTYQRINNVIANETYDFKDFKTEKIASIEVGYKGVLFDRLMIDAYYYHSRYQDFISEIDLVQGDQVYGFDVNAEGDVLSQGWAAGLDFDAGNGYRLGATVSFNELISQDELVEQGLRADFNTPEWVSSFTFGNREVVDNLGFNISARWQQAFLWQSAFGNGVIPAFTTVDAQVNYKVESIKTVVKLGGSNILNERYTTGIGNPRVGALYYVSLTFDEFFN